MNEVIKADRWKQWLLILLSLLVSLLAVLVSIRSCRVAERSLRLATDRFEIERSLILIGEVSEDEKFGEFLRLRPYSSDVILTGGIVYFPTKLEENEAIFDDSFTQISAGRPHITVALMFERHRLEQIYREKIGEGEDTTYFRPTYVPIIVTAEYIVKADKFLDTAIYKLRYMVRKVGKEKDVEVGFIGVEFDRRMKNYDRRRRYRIKIEEINDLMEELM